MAHYEPSGSWKPLIGYRHILLLIMNRVKMELPYWLPTKRYQIGDHWETIGASVRRFATSAFLARQVAQRVDRIWFRFNKSSTVRQRMRSRNRDALRFGFFFAFGFSKIAGTAPFSVLIAFSFLHADSCQGLHKVDRKPTLIANHDQFIISS